MPLLRTLASLLILTTPLLAQAPQEKVIERYKQMLAMNPAEGTALDRLWKLYLDQGKTTELIAEYRKDDNFASQLVLGHLLRKAGQLEEAQAAYERAAKLDELSALPVLALARMAADAGKAREAAGWYEKAVAVLPKADPQTPEVLMQLGAQWLAMGDLTKAAEAWEMTVAANPADLDLRRRLADTYAANHLAAQAIVHLDYLVQHAPPAERATALQQQARIHQGAGQQDAAIAALEKALALTTPGNWLRAELQSQLIRLHQRYHRTEELEGRWMKYAEENPRDLSGYLQLIDLYERLGDLEKERAWLEKLTALVPKNVDYRLRLARLLVQMDALDAAALAYDALLKEQPGTPEYVFERARIDVQRDAAPAARERVERLLAVRKGDETIRAKALEFYEQNRLKEAIEQHLTADATAADGDEALLALATFYFTQRREAEARQALDRLAKRGATPAAQAAARLKVAQALKGQNQFPAAIAELEAAVKLQPEVRDVQMLLGELHAALGQHDAAQAAFQRAFELSKTPEAEAEADLKLFETFRAQSPESPLVRRVRPSLTLPVPGLDPAVLSSPALEKQLAAMESAASQQAGEKAWLRLARWRLWTRDVRAAHEAVGRALAIQPQSVAAYEMLVKLATADGPSPAAVFHLMKLVEIDAPNRANYQRRAGQIELQAGRINEALAIFEGLVSESPGNLDALTDLALTQQRAERWTDALETWRRVYALSPVSKKREVFGPLLRVLERLEMHQQAAELQLKAIESEQDERQRFQLFTELLGHCTKRGLLDWLRTEFEQRRRLRADDYFTEMALGRILKATGNKAAAFEVLADASYAAPNQAEALPDLIHEAEELRKLDAAIKLQAQLVRIVPQTRPDGFEKLAQLQEKNFEHEEAAKTWDRIVAKFPRDSTVLAHAVEFQLRWGTPARAIELLRKLRALEPRDIKALATLAELSQEAGALTEAESCLEEILKNSKPEAPGDALRYPALKPEDAGRLQTAYLTTVRQRKGRSSAEALRALRSFWVEETLEPRTAGEREQRLEAIRALAQLVRERDDPAALKAWTERWRISGAPSEALWALYFAGAGEALLDRMETIMQAVPNDTKAPQAYIWLALQTGQFARLSAWLQDRRRTASDRDYLLIALGQYVTMNEGKIDPALVEKLFPSGFSLRLWQTASLFASRNHFREAAQLGRRVFENVTTQRALFGRELAHWHLYLGEVDAARAILRTAIASAAESFDADVYGALREYYLLMPEAERAAFVETYLAGIDEQRQPLHLALAGTLLRALAGDEAAARKHLDALLAMRALASSSTDDAASAGPRRWRLLLTAGSQLQLWHFESLAMHLWERALADEALIQLEGEQAKDIAREVRQRLAALRAARAPASEVQAAVDAFGGASTRDGLIPLGESLEALGAYGRAIEVYRQLWERDPANPQTLRNLLNACRAGNDHESAEAALWQAINVGPSRANDITQRDLVLQLVDLLERKGELARARRVLGEGVENAPADTRLLLRLGQLHERAGERELAESVYRRLLTVEPMNIVARAALAGVLDANGRTDAAIALLARGGSPDVDARLAALQLKANQIDDALATLERIAPPMHVTPSLSIATALAERGQHRLARSVIQSAITRTTDAGMSFPLYCKAVELLTPAEGSATAQRELRRLRQIASGQPALLGSYLDFGLTQAKRLGIEAAFTTELRTLWAEGSGPVAAGAVLLASELDKPKEAEETLGRIFARDDAGEVWLLRLIGVLDAASRPELALRVRERLAQVNPSNAQPTLDWVAALQKLGRTAEARTAIEKLAMRTVIDEDSTGKVAQAFATLGDTERAKKLFAQALRSDPHARNFPAYLDYARLQIAEKDFNGARRTLRVAFANPANREFALVADFLAAAGRMAEAENEIASLGLSPARQTGVRRELFASLAKERQLAPALAIIDGHPETLTPAMTGVLRELARESRDFEPVAVLLDKLAKQTPDNAELTLELARLLADWSEADLAASKTDAAIEHLRRGHELRPDVYEVARRLATLQSQTGSAKAATATIESFLAAASNPVEIAKAQELLARLKQGGKL